MKPTHTQQAAEEYAYQHLEQSHPAVISAIEADIKQGVTPERIESIWRRTTGHDQMATMVGLAARYTVRTVDSLS